MKICMLVSRVPWPLEKGDKLRAYHQLRFLARDHDVHLFCLSDGPVDHGAVAHLKTITPHVTVFRLNPLKIVFRMLAAFFSRKPFQVHYFYQRSIAARLRRSIDAFHPDIVYCQLIRCSEYVKHLHHYSKTLDYMDALSSGQQRRAMRAPWYIAPFVREEAKRLTAYEHLVFDYFEHHCIISEQDRRLIYHPQSDRIHVVPNGIDANYFSPNTGQLKMYDLLFTGNMSYPPNVEGAQRLVNDVLPLVHQVKPNVTLLLAGANPTSAVRSLASEAVTVSGWLDDMRSAYSEAKVFVAPMRSGSGMQNKLLEAMCMELPCVTTSLAAAPLSALHGSQVLIGNSDEEIAQHILYLLDNPKQADELARKSRLFVQENFEWASTVKDLVDHCFC